jgi:tRNA(fMet)-specific endonuclease VapC
MTLKYLLDTNILSEAKRPRPNQNVMEKLSLYKREIATATLVIHELLFGCFRLPESKKRRDLEDYINSVLIAQLPLFDYDLKSAQYYAQERARLSKIGKTPAFVDGQIASIAVCNNLILVTNNISDFEDFDRLQIENWLSESTND